MDKQRVIECYRQHSGDQYAVARVLGDLTPIQVMDTVRSVERRPSEGVSYIVSVKRPPSSIGRPALREKILSIRHRDDSGWPVEDRTKIEEARASYDLGYIELAQGREGPWIIQYVFRRRRPARKREIWLNNFSAAVDA